MKFLPTHFSDKLITLSNYKYYINSIMFYVLKLSLEDLSQNRCNPPECMNNNTL